MSAAAVGCGPKHGSFVRVDDVALGRVVIYRNGVAFYERRAKVSGGLLTVSVPRERVDDFLKSLTVVDAISRQPLPVSIPRRESGDGTNLVLQLQLPSPGDAEVVLTYVTESPAWKPSYRVVVGDHHDVMLEGWAIVDNTSGEDWKNVVVGVGSSSALSFRYDLWSVRQIQRETLANEERFAVAPPTGVSPYGAMAKKEDAGDQPLGELETAEIRGAPDQATDGDAAKLSELAESVAVTGGALSAGSDEAIQPPTISTSRANRLVQREAPHPAKTARPAAGVAAPSSYGIASGDAKIQQLSQQLAHTDKTIVIEGSTLTADAAATQRASDRANAVRNQLIDHGVAPARIKVVTKVDASRPERVRLVAQVGPAESHRPGARPAVGADAQPVGESHFENTRPMSVERGSSAMVSMVRGPTEGEEVYLYDAESERGNAEFAFRAVRFKNPTDSTLETGPVTVYGKERFIGEGLTEPIPPKASAVVPFALDRQVVVEHDAGNEDRLSRLVSLQRGVMTAEVQHIRRQRLHVTNRLPQPTKLFIRHTVTKGWSLIDAPPAFERIGDAHLFEIALKPNETRDVVIAESTPIERSLDLGADATLDMMKVWLDAPDGAPALKDQLRKVLAIHKTLVDAGQTQDSLRRRLADYRGRMDELHAQLVTLQAVKTGSDLTGHLKAKMKDISDRVQKTTIEIVDQEEKIMLARVQFQDALSELALPDALAAAQPKKPAHH